MEKTGMKMPYQVMVGVGKWQPTQAHNGREAICNVTGATLLSGNGTGNTGKGATYREYDMYITQDGRHPGAVCSVRVG